uniref:Putative secreted protein n=1 Tax=Anopheles darlingi TaxID=43151 RepID=A0A2M4DL04_ANODA
MSLLWPLAWVALQPMVSASSCCHCPNPIRSAVPWPRSCVLAPRLSHCPILSFVSMKTPMLPGDSWAPVHHRPVQGRAMPADHLCAEYHHPAQGWHRVWAVVATSSV